MNYREYVWGHGRVFSCSQFDRIWKLMRTQFLRLVIRFKFKIWCAFLETHGFFICRLDWAQVWKKQVLTFLKRGLKWFWNLEFELKIDLRKLCPTHFSYWKRFQPYQSGHSPLDILTILWFLKNAKKNLENAI